MSGSLVPSYERTLRLPLIIPERTTLRFPPKDPGDTLDYALDITSWLYDINDTVSGWSVTSYAQSVLGLTIEQQAAIGGMLIADFGAGTNTQDYPLQYEVITVGGRRLSRTVWLTVLQQTAEYQFGSPVFTMPIISNQPVPLQIFPGSLGGTVTLPFGGNCAFFQGTIDAPTEFALSGGSNGVAQQLILAVQQNDAGGNAITFASNILFSGGTPAPALDPDSYSLFEFYSLGAGLYVGTYLGASSGAADVMLSSAAMTAFMGPLDQENPDTENALWSNGGQPCLTPGGSMSSFTSGSLTDSNFIQFMLSLPAGPATAANQLVNNGGVATLSPGGTPAAYTPGLLSVANYTAWILSLPDSNPGTANSWWNNGGAPTLTS